MPEQPESEDLAAALDLAVKRHTDIVAGWSDEEIVQQADENATVIASAADALWSNTPWAGQVLEALGVGIAILARRPNGVTFRGRHWCTREHDSCLGEGQMTLEHRDGTGVVYTPRWMADKVAGDAINAVIGDPGPLHTWKADTWKLRPLNELVNLCVADIACGAGVFLLTAVLHLSDVMADGLADIIGAKTALRRAARATVIRKCIFGVDIDDQSVDFARLVMALLVPLDDIDVEIAGRVIVGDALIGGPCRCKTPCGREGIPIPDEVCERGGFDAIVGNPPWLGGNKIGSKLGAEYRDYIVQHVASGQKGAGRTDLAAYFALRGFTLLNEKGQLAILATNTLPQGDTKRVGLDAITADGGVIWQAVKSAAWPTPRASVHYTAVWITRAPFTNDMCHFLNKLSPPEEEAA